MPQGFLAYEGKEMTTIGGLGDFRADFPPREVPADVAHQYDTPEARAAGWVVTWASTEEEGKEERIEQGGEPHVEEES